MLGEICTEGDTDFGGGGWSDLNPRDMAVDYDVYIPYRCQYVEFEGTGAGGAGFTTDDTQAPCITPFALNAIYETCKKIIFVKLCVCPISWDIKVMPLYDATGGGGGHIKGILDLNKIDIFDGYLQVKVGETTTYTQHKIRGLKSGGKWCYVGTSATVNNLNGGYRKDSDWTVVGGSHKYWYRDLTSSLTLNNEELVMRPQKILFNSPDDFLKNLNKISLNINQSIFEYNIKDKEVTDIRKKLNEKLDEKQNYEETLKLYNDEINNLELKFKEMKIKYDSLFTYKKNLIILIQTSKESNLFLCEKKIFDIYKRIMSNSHILKKIKKKFNEKINTIMYLREIEKCINLLLKWEKNQIKHNFVTYSKIKKEIEKEKRLEIYQILKAKEKEKFELKLKKIIEKNNKLIIKPFKKVGIKYKID